MVKQVWIRNCYLPKPFNCFDLASFEAFVLVQDPSDLSVVQVIKKRSSLSSFSIKASINLTGLSLEMASSKQEKVN
jgi:hypothetical protein